MTLSLSQPWQVSLEVTVISVHGPAPDTYYGVTFHVERVSSKESSQSVRDFLSSQMAQTIRGAPKQRGLMWWHALSEAGEIQELGPPPELKGPTAIVAGRRDQQTTERLDTGRPPTTIEMLRAWFNQESQSSVGVYLNVPCAYIVAGARYWGRALRFNDRWLNINTNNVVPGLGVRLRCDLTLEVNGVKRPVSVKGIMTRKLSPPAGSTYTGALGVRINDIDELDCPGLLLHFLECRLNEESEDTKR